MEEKILLKVGSKKLHLIKLIGAFVVLGASLMLLADLYQLASIASILMGPTGQSITLNFQGMMLEKTIGELDKGFQAGLVLKPLAGVMFWSAIVSIGAVIYRTGGLVLPITEKLKKMDEGDSETEEDSSEGPGRKRYIEAKGKGKYVCPTCGEEFDSKRGLHIHQSKSH